MEARIHLAEPSPPYCAACHQAVPEKRHVDFGAATDGPMLPALDGVVGVVGHSIDDIIICEDCLKEAGRLIGYENAEELREELDAEREANERLHEQLQGTREGVAGALDQLRGHVTAGTPPTLPNSILPVSAAVKKRPARPRRERTPR